MNRIVSLSLAAILAAGMSFSSAEAAQGRKGSMLAGAALGAAAIGGAALLLNSGRPAHAGPQIVEEDVEYTAAPRRPRYVPSCQMVRKKVWIDDETYTYKRVEVCE